MGLPGFADLMLRADCHGHAVPIAAAGGADSTVLEALRIATDRGWVLPLVSGQESSIRSIAEEHRIDLTGFRLLDSDQPAQAAVAECLEGRARILLKGQIATPALMEAVLHPEFGLRTGRVISQVVLMELPRDHRRFLMSDTGIMVRPNSKSRAEILGHCVEMAHALGLPEPRVALMAASESVRASMPETVVADELTRRAAAGEFPHCLVHGPLSFDLAYAADAADRKRVGGPVVGAADAMVFPDLCSANLTVKAIMYTADCAFGGVLCGTTHPVAFMSRADSVTTRLRSIALALALLPGTD